MIRRLCEFLEKHEGILCPWAWPIIDDTHAFTLRRAHAQGGDCTRTWEHGRAMNAWRIGDLRVAGEVFCQLAKSHQMFGRGIGRITPVHEHQ